MAPLRECRDFGDAIRRAQMGQGPGFEWLFERFGRPVGAFVRAQGWGDSDDIVSEVFLAAFSNLKTFSGGENNFVAWLFRIARNKMIDEARRQARRPDTEHVAAESPAADNTVSAVERIQCEGLLRTLSSLTEDQRTVLVLRIVNDMSVQDAAYVMERSVGAIKQLQHRALEQARRLIEQGVVTK